MKTAALVMILLATHALADERPLPEEPPAPTPPLVEDTLHIVDAPPSHRLTGVPVSTTNVATAHVATTKVAMTPSTPHLVAASTDEKPARSLGGTGEFAFGFGQWRGGGDSINGWAPNFGVGGFVSPHIALSFRVAGVAVVDGAVGWVGVMGPHAQLWLGDQVWTGFGFGVALAGACGPGFCGGAQSTGIDARFGFAFKPRGQAAANLAVELTTFEGFQTLSFLLGYQSF